MPCSPSPRSSLLTLSALALAGLLSVSIVGCRNGSTGSANGPGGAEGAKVGARPPAPRPKPQPIEARALYMTGWTAGGRKSRTRMMDLIDKTPLNAVVIDVKDSDGAVSYKSEVPLAQLIMSKAGSVKEVNAYGYGKRVADIDQVLADLKKRDIYPIARLAVFEDDILPRVKPDVSVRKANGGIWMNRKKMTWCSPYSKAVWEYNVALAEEALKKGFKEIQWDYVRFPTDGKLSDIKFADRTKTPANQQIADFLRFASKRVHAAGGVMSADIFGLTVLSKSDMGIGQTIRTIADNCDYICPMVYPSHYNRGEYGIPNPDKEPYKIVFVSLRDGLKRIKGTKCKIRPWLQNFNLQSKYSAPEIWAQIKAARDNGINEYLLWDPNNRFTHTAAAFQLMAQVEAKEKKTASAKPTAPKAPAPKPTAP